MTETATRTGMARCSDTKTSIACCANQSTSFAVVGAYARLSTLRTRLPSRLAKLSVPNDGAKHIKLHSSQITLD